MSKNKKRDHNGARTDWAGTDSPIVQRVVEQSNACLAAYQANPLLVDEHANIEIATAQGGYGRRQIYELVQNGADALLSGHAGKIEVLLTRKALYCANEGQPLDVRGAECLLSSHVSMKRGTEIGRFGLGFKSVLGVSNEPEFYSRSGSFCFNEEESRHRILQVVPSAQRIPFLRIGVPVDPGLAAEADNDLAKLMEWATTVVKLPRVVKKSATLPEDIEKFPAEFLLFSPHVSELVLIDEQQHRSRSISVRNSGKRLVLVEGSNTSLWSTFKKVHCPSDAAREDAGELAKRDEIPIIWAVPTKGRQHKVGTFWAFFPTVDQTTLSGIANAPWKTNEDRQNLLPGDFNEELLRELADLVVSSIRRLSDDHDPASYLDMLPGRGREARCWADEYLTTQVYEIARDRESLPDQLGELRLPEELRLHPQGVSSDALEAWASYAGRPVDWCHPSVETRERRPRVERLMDENCASHREWLEALATADETPEASMAAMRTAALVLRDCTPSEAAAIHRAKIVLTASGELVAPDPASVFLANLDYDRAPGVPVLHPAIQGHPDAQECIEELGLRVVDRTGELLAFLEQANKGHDVEWGLFWSLTRGLAVDQTVTALRGQTGDLRALVRMRTLAGSFEPINEILWPGPIVSSQAGVDQCVTIDSEFHAQDQALAVALGAVPTPLPDGGSTEESWFRRYRDECRTVYRGQLSTRRRPETEMLVFRRPPAFPGPLEPLLRLSAAASERFCTAVLEGGPSTGSWRMGHKSQGDIYPDVQMKSPLVWMIAERGWLPTTLGEAYPARECASPILKEASAILPVACVAQEFADALGLPASLEQIDAKTWKAALDRAAVSADDELIGRTYELACRFVDAPENLRCRVGREHQNRGCNEIVLLSDDGQFEALVERLVPVIRVASDDVVDLLLEHWCLRPAAEVVQTQIDCVLASAPSPIADDYPVLYDALPDTSLRVARCSELRVETVTPGGKTSTAVDHCRQGDVLYVIDTTDEEDLLGLVAKESGLDLPDHRSWAAGVVSAKRGQKREQRAKVISAQPDLRTRVLATLGRELLLRRLPKPLIDAAVAERGGLSDQEIADLALAVYSVGLLREYRVELAEADLEPPSTWAGSHAARRFVRDLGFPMEFAGAPQARADALLRVFGTPDLPPLHEFQQKISDKTVAMLAASAASRGMLSLPTGAGKTRVAVESLVTWYRDSGFEGPVLWIAHSEELCEQAVQTFSYIWRAAGPPEELFISRLWSTNEVEPVDGAPQFVVATIQKLQGCVNDPAYDWLAECACVVIDEAHKATEKSYTSVLEWTGLGRSKAKDRCPLLGLTATPYRGRSDEQTKRLVAKFGDRLDRGVLPENPYDELQRLGVISRAKHEVLTGVHVQLNRDEADHIGRLKRLPDSVAERIGADVSRNRTLLESVKNLPNDWPVLLFAASVSHAQTMAALLQLEGVSAVAVHGGTETNVRRHCIKEFREGRLRVLTNYGVFTEGFDVPGVRAVYIARPTFSPGLYQQMVGRGLRGPANGGKEECLIVNVEDNFSQFGEELAFREFEYLWDEKGE